MRNLIITLSIILVALLGLYFVPFSITINEPKHNAYLEVNDTLLINVPAIDIMNSKVTLYIKLSDDDYTELPEGLSWKRNIYHKVYYTSNPKDINQIIKSMRSIITYGDIATATSEIIIARNDSTIFHSHIVIDSESGIQDGNKFGYCRIIDNNCFLDAISKMEPYYFPVLSLK